MSGDYRPSPVARAVAYLIVGIALSLFATFLLVGPFPPSSGIAAGPSEGGVMVVGDSVARSLVAGLQQVGIPATNRTVVGCSLLQGTSDIGHAISCGPLRAYLQQQRPKYVLLVSGIYETLDVRPKSTVLRPGTAAYAAYYRSSLQSTINALSSTGAIVVIPTVPCINGVHLPANVRAQTVDNPVRLRVEDALLREVVAANRRVLSPDLRAFLCPHGRFQASLGAVRVMRPDGEHFSTEGARAVGRWLIEQIPGLKSAPHRGTSEADVLVGKLTSAEVFCAFQPTPPSRYGIMATVHCAKQHKTFVLRTFRDARSERDFTALAVAVNCQHRGTVTYLLGSDWLVTGDAARYASSVLGGKLQVSDCRATSHR